VRLIRQAGLCTELTEIDSTQMLSKHKRYAISQGPECEQILASNQRVDYAQGSERGGTGGVLQGSSGYQVVIEAAC
jgi:hypothetical protein